MVSIQVQGAPNIYVCEEGALNKLGQVIRKHFDSGLLIHGTQSWQVAADKVERLSLPTTLVQYKGECSKAEVERLTQKARNENVDYILGVGGGKIMDLTKAVADELHLPYLLVPTLASNCAPWTPLTVFYDESGRFTHYEMFDQGAFMLAVEPGLIIDSPQSYLRAGIGDTIAKWYEADVLSRNLVPKPLAVDFSLHAARLCRDVLISEGDEALKARTKGQVTSSFVKVIETIIMAGGMVGGFGDQYGRIAGAHSIHNGLTVLEETHHLLHGDKVAYGILVQLALEHRFDEIDKLLPYYRKLGLPASFIDLGITTNHNLAYEQVAKAATKPTESIHLMEVSTEEVVAEAMKNLENWIEAKKEGGERQ